MSQSNYLSFHTPEVPAIVLFKKMGLAPVFMILLVPASLGTWLFPQAQNAWAEGHPAGMVLALVAMALPAVWLALNVLLRHWHTPRASAFYWPLLYRREFKRRYLHADDLVAWGKTIPTPVGFAKSQPMTDALSLEKALTDALNPTFIRGLAPKGLYPRGHWAEDMHRRFNRSGQTEGNPLQLVHIRYEHLWQGRILYRLTRWFTRLDELLSLHQTMLDLPRGTVLTQEQIHIRTLQAGRKALLQDWDNQLPSRRIAPEAMEKLERKVYDTFIHSQQGLAFHLAYAELLRLGQKSTHA